MQSATPKEAIACEAAFLMGEGRMPQVVTRVPVVEPRAIAKAFFSRWSSPEESDPSQRPQPGGGGEGREG